MLVVFDFVVLVLFPEPVGAELPLLDPVMVPDAEPVFLPVAVAEVPGLLEVESVLLACRLRTSYGGHGHADENVASRSKVEQKTSSWRLRMLCTVEERAFRPWDQSGWIDLVGQATRLGSRQLCLGGSRDGRALRTMNRRDCGAPVICCRPLL